MARHVHQHHQDHRLQHDVFRRASAIRLCDCRRLAQPPYSPAKYGILTEYLPHRLLVVANGWIEGLTVGAIILGVVIGGTLIQPSISTALLNLDFPIFDTGIDTFSEMAIVFVSGFYILAAIFNLYIP